jgi:hypothetical protein
VAEGGQPGADREGVGDPDQRCTPTAPSEDMSQIYPLVPAK